MPSEITMSLRELYTNLGNIKLKRTKFGQMDFASRNFDPNVVLSANLV